ncbi:MAG TPA: hypothetical protein VGB87_18235 [Vicinamibacteria bacterium]
MPRFADLLGLFGSAVVIVAGAAAAGRRLGLPRSKLASLTGVVAVAALVPIGGLPLSALLRGIAGDWSLTTLILLLGDLHRAFRPGEETFSPRGVRALQVLLTAGGLFLYPLALGLGAWDPYRLGYGHPWLVAVLLLVALGSLLLDLRLVTFAVALAVLSWAAAAGESRNLWDYLLDPPVFLWSLASLLARASAALARGRRRGGDEPVRIPAGSSR